MNARMRNQYLTDSVTTASPATLLVQLWDRLVLDLERAEAAIALGDRTQTNEQLCHAQAIISELLATLDTSAWSGGDALAQIYLWSNETLVRANLEADGARVADVRGVLAPLRDAWREAARTSAPAPADATGSTSLSATA